MSKKYELHIVVVRARCASPNKSLERNEIIPEAMLQPDYIALRSALDKNKKGN
jgi:hypothetical protein